jgi:putative aldouronate transport system substrate-binding protein
MRKKFLASLLALSLLVCAMAGCGSSSTTSTETTAETTTETTTETAAAEEEAAAAEETETAAAEEAPAESAEAEETPAAQGLDKPASPVTISYMVTINPANMNLYDSFDDLLVWQELADRTNVTVDAVLVNAQEGQTKFNLMVASGDYTDWMDSVSSNYSTGLVGAMDDEVIIDMTDIINNEMPNYSAVLYSEEEYIKGATMDDGRMGMVYSLTRVDSDECTSGPVIRQDWLDALGLDTPVTYDDLHDVLTAFKENYGASMWIPYSGSPMGNYLGAGFGISTTYMTHLSGREPFYQVDGEIKFGPIEDAYYDYLELMAQWYSEGLIWSDFTSYTEKFDAPPADKVLDGTFGVWFGNTNDWQTWTSQATDPNFHCVAFSDPVMNEGDINHLRTYNEHITNGGISISTQCEGEKLDAAVYLLDYFFSEEGSFLCTFGVEGVTYELDENGHPQYTELITNNPDGLQERQALVMYGGSTVSTAYEHPDADYLIDTDTDDQNAASDIWKATSDAAYDIPDLCTVSADDSANYAAIMADIGTYISEWTLKIITGQETLTKEGFEEYRNNVYAMNIADAIAIKQDALDRYNAR